MKKHTKAFLILSAALITTAASLLLPTTAKAGAPDPEPEEIELELPDDRLEYVSNYSVNC